MLQHQVDHRVRARGLEGARAGQPGQPGQEARDGHGLGEHLTAVVEGGQRSQGSAGLQGRPVGEGDADIFVLDAFWEDGEIFFIAIM